MGKPGKWYVVQSLSGHEMKIKESLEKRIELEEMQDVLFDVLVPMEKVTEVKLGKKRTVNRKFFPGYILLNVALYNEDGTMNSPLWSFVNDTPGIIGFVGGDRPTPLSDREVNDIMEQLSRDEEVARPKIDFEMGDVVRIKDGAFENFDGKITSIDPARGRLKLSVSIFGRSTPVEVEYWQVEREE